MRNLVSDAEACCGPPRSKVASTSARHAATERSVNIAKSELANVEHAVVERARRTARQTDEYVRDNPWTAVGVGAGVGLLLGLLLGRR